MLINNYHTHTYRCGHASGKDEEYVLEAIGLGIKELGFSDHIPFIGVTQSGIRMDYNQIDDYINSINYLKEKYKDKINILVGFEAEYDKKYLPYYKSLLNKVDYLICGQHFHVANESIFYYAGDNNSEENLLLYTDEVIEAMKSGLFKYIAHPDMIIYGYTGRPGLLNEQIERICKASIEYDIPLEINLEGMRKKEKEKDPFGEWFYPFPSFWEKVSKYGCKVVIGIDSHSPQTLKDYRKTYEDAMCLVSKYKLNYIKSFKI